MKRHQKKPVETKMSFAVVELKYQEKKTFTVAVECIQNFQPKASAVESYFCYISTDITEEPDFNAKYMKTFDGQPGLFKVFIKKIFSK